MLTTDRLINTVVCCVMNGFLLVSLVGKSRARKTLQNVCVKVRLAFEHVAHTFLPFLSFFA